MWRRGKRIRWPIIGVAALVLAGSGTAYAVTNADPAPDYRTLTATKGDVEQTLSTSGTVDAARRADLEFATSGTVARLLVAVGDTVKAGQVVAVLDTEELAAAVTRAEASVAQAVAQLASDRTAQNDTVAAANTPTDSPTKPSNTPSTGGSTTTAAVLAALKAEQDDVLTAQSAATAAIAAAKDALAAQTAACATAFQDTEQTEATQDGSDTTADTTADRTADQAATDADNAACTAALAEVQDRQDDVKDAQDALAKALSALSSTLTKALATLSASTSTGPSSSARSSASSADTPSSADPTGSSSGTVTAARLAADQAQIEQAKADLVGAEQQLSQAKLRSTRSGTVVSLAIAKGDEVSAGATAAVVVGGKAITVSATVAESKIDQVKVGQKVRVTTPGESDSVEGTVSAIGLVADSSSGTASYPVTVVVEDPTIALPTGSTAMLEIVLATAKDVVTVPISAVIHRGNGTFVRVWDGKTLTQKSVTLGTMGSRRVEVTKGLAAGDQVVLADVDQAITGASDTVNDRGGFSGNGPDIKFSGPGGGPPVTFQRAD